jgi:prevent-host-death family protein
MDDRVRRTSHSRYNAGMADVASRELRNQTRALLDRVAAGEDIRITVDGRPVAILVATPHRRRFMPRAEFATHVLAHQADAALRDELRALLPDTTDDLP